MKRQTRFRPNNRKLWSGRNHFRPKKWSGHGRTGARTLYRVSLTGRTADDGLGNRHDELLQVTILLPTIFVSQSRVLLKIVLALLETPHYHCLAIVRMGAHTVYFDLKNRFFRCSRLINLHSFCSSSDLFAFINHQHLLLSIFKCEENMNCVGTSDSK